MTDAAVHSIPESEVRGRSLFQLAVLRFRRNRPAMAGAVMLVLIACFSFFGPLFISHSYDQVFSSYVTNPPSLEPRPGEDTLEEAMESVATRARVELRSFSVEGEAFTAVITARTIAERSSTQVSFRNPPCSVSRLASSPARIAPPAAAAR